MKDGKVMLEALTAAGMKITIDGSLERLQTDYIDVWVLENANLLSAEQFIEAIGNMKART